MDAGWTDLLTRWSADLLADPEIAAQLPPDAVATGWLGFPPATEEQIERAEARLGTALPPSYRAFLHVTNGWRHTGYFVRRLWSTEEIAWFRLRNQAWIGEWLEGERFHAREYGTRVAVPGAEYFIYGPEQLTTSMLERLEPGAGGYAALPSHGG